MPEELSGPQLQPTDWRVSRQATSASHLPRVLGAKENFCNFRVSQGTLESVTGPLEGNVVPLCCKMRCPFDSACWSMVTLQLVISSCQGGEQNIDALCVWHGFVHVSLPLPITHCFHKTSNVIQIVHKNTYSNWRMPIIF